MTDENLYQQYAYSYPHKHAYRPLEERSLKDVWKNEDLSNLFAYIHIPFCGIRCGFCNLFTIANPKEGIDSFLKALSKEAKTYQEHLPDATFEEYAIGGGTPTFLSELELERMLDIFKNELGVDTNSKYGSIEASPKTINAEKLNTIANFGIDRISLGIQSWIENETKLLGRPQNINEANKAVNHIINSKVPEFNLDLIYGTHQQTKKSWLYSLEKTIDYRPTEIFLYPLYTRPLTGLHKMQQDNEDNRLELYRFGRDFLKSNGYYQISMRCFRKKNAPPIQNNYSSQKDGMIGIGAGARSYTKNLHYSTNYAVTRKATKDIIAQYSNSPRFDKVNYGIELNKDERIKRYLIKSLIDGGKLNREAFKIEFDTDLNQLDLFNLLFEKKWLMESDNHYHLSEEGMEREDMIGPLLFSKQVLKLMEEYKLH
jgi:oxygen-independent coproporphyrinogen-3 oxidase